jgi:hypothetical protein
VEVSPKAAISDRGNLKTATPLNTAGISLRVRKSPGYLNTPGDLYSQMLGLFDDDGVFFANFDAAFAAQALFGVNGFGFAVFHFKYLCGANVNALLAPNAFFLIHDRIKSHDLTPFKIIFH